MIQKIDFNMQNIFRLADIEDACFGKDAWSINNLRGEFSNSFSCFLGYFVDDEIVGYVCVRTMYEEAQVCNIAVLPDFRHQGIASQLVSAMIDHSVEKGCIICELEVNTENTPAIELYKKCGFQVVGTRKNFYRRNRYNSRDAYTMTRQIAESPNDNAQ